MYYPYFRGKQNELITIRECAELFNESGFVPIIEPVKETLSGLQRAIESVLATDSNVMLIVNPNYGDHKQGSDAISVLWEQQFANNECVIPAIHLSEANSVEDALTLYDRHHKQKHDVAFIHAGFSNAKDLAAALGDNLSRTTHIFIEAVCGKLYQKHFRGSRFRVLVRDGFQRRVNREHPAVEFFSDLHATYEDENVDGFGDFLMVGDDYSESGGPAYAIAIHITFIDDDKDDEMHIHHFVSIRQDSPTDPAGKFLEALTKLVEEVQKPETKIHRTTAIEEFLSLHKRQHFPGLGYVKKLSMKHHLETLAQYFQ